MRIKAEAKPMQEIIRRLMQDQEIEVIIFQQEMILEQPIAEWPKNIHVIIAFQSLGFPLFKVIEYVKLNQCICINGDLTNQEYFSDREKTKEMLRRHNIDQPRYMAVHRQREYCRNCLKRLQQLGIPPVNCTCILRRQAKVDNFDIPDICDQCSYFDPKHFEATDSSVTYCGQLLNRPFVEKPVDADNHNIYIYKSDKLIKLYRKRKDSSSQTVEGVFMPRTNGCFIYEEFLEAQEKKDLKVYTIYPNYCLCELRKAPHVDGIVNRDPVSGKEIRHQTLLTDKERQMAKIICVIFQQLICGLDIIRTVDGRSLVVDINGFSFVKENEHYYDQSANILRRMIIQEINRYNYFRHQIIFDGNKQMNRYFFNKELTEQSTQTSRMNQLSTEYIEQLQKIGHNNNYDTYKGNNYIEQRGLISIMSNADMAPKFKYKFTSNNQQLYDIFFEEGNEQTEYKLRLPYSQERSKQISKQLMKLIANHVAFLDEKPKGIKTFSNSVCGFSKTLSKEVQRDKESIHNRLQQIDNDSISIEWQLNHLTQQEIEGIKLVHYLFEKNLAGTKLQVRKINNDSEAQYIIKWGGYLTVSGARQAFYQGKQYKEHYCKGSLQQDIKIFYKNETRMIRTAQYFLLGYLSQDFVTIEKALKYFNDDLRSDQLAPDPFTWLEEEYGMEKTIPHFDKSLTQIKSRMTVEDQVLDFTSRSVKEMLQENQMELNKYMQSTKGYFSQDSVCYANKMFTAFRLKFDGILLKMKRRHNGSITHFEILKLIGDKCNMLYEKLAVITSSPPFMDMEYPFFIRSFKYTINQYIVLGRQFQYDISKLQDINNFIQYIIVHHKELFEDQEMEKLVIDLYQLVHMYYEPFMTQFYGTTQLQQTYIGQKISYNLLQTIQQDIDTTYNYYRQCDQQIIDKYTNNDRKAIQASYFRQLGDTPLEQAASGAEGCNSKVAAFAMMSSMERLPIVFDMNTNGTRSRAESICNSSCINTKEYEEMMEKGVSTAHFYVTDKAHLYTLYSLLTQAQSNLQPYLLHNKEDIFNPMSSINFMYYEMTQKDYYQKLRSGKITNQDIQTIITLSQQKNNTSEFSDQAQQENKDISAPHRFIEVLCSFGVTNDIYQPTPHNVLPIDQPEQLFCLFPFRSICKYNNRIFQQTQQQKDVFNLVSVVGVYRHGDRCPKQKIKISVNSPTFFDFLVEHFGLCADNPIDVSINLKDVDRLNTFCIAFKQFLQSHSDQHILNYNSLRQLYDVIKPRPPVLKVEIKFPTPFVGVKQCQIIAKYGGILTTLGQQQAQLCGQLLHQHILEDLNDQNLDYQKQLLKSDINVFTNDEQRVKDTAVSFMHAFCKSFGVSEVPKLVELEMLSIVDQRARQIMAQEKELINKILTLNTNLTSITKDNHDIPKNLLQSIKQFDPQQLEDIGNPYSKLVLLKSFLDQILHFYDRALSSEEFSEQQNQQIRLTVARFQSVYEAFVINDHEFNVSKIPDIYDLMRYDALHPILQSPTLTTLYKQAYEQAKTLAKFIAPNEFGTNQRNRMVISSLIAHELLDQIVRSVQTPGIDLFFVSESHITALIYLFISTAGNFPEYDNAIDFICHLIIKVFKNQADDKYRIEVFVSSGSYQNPFKCEYGVPRIMIPRLIGDNYDLYFFQQMKEKVGHYSELFKERFDLGFELIIQ